MGVGQGPMAWGNRYKNLDEALGKYRPKSNPLTAAPMFYGPCLDGSEPLGDHENAGTRLAEASRKAGWQLSGDGRTAHRATCYLLDETSSPWHVSDSFASDHDYECALRLLPHIRRCETCLPSEVFDDGRTGH